MAYPGAFVHDALGKEQFSQNPRRFGSWYNDYKSKVRPQPITGYGNQAYYDGYASLNVLKGDYYLRVAVAYLRVAVAPAGAPPSLSDEEQLATAILAKL